MVFKFGTHRFIEASSIADKMIQNGITSDGIALLDQTLAAAQRSGLLVQSPLNLAHFDPNDPNDPIIYPGIGDRTLLTSPRGYRFRIQSSGKPVSQFHGGTDFAVYRSDWSRYEQGEVGVRSRESTTIQLSVSKLWGLQAKATGATIRGDYSHLHGARTLMDYLALYGFSGVIATGDGLANVPAGARIGSIGSTGESTGPHIDLITSVHNAKKREWEKRDPLEQYPTLSKHPESAWSQINAGHSESKMSWDTYIENWKYEEYKWQALTPWISTEFMKDDAVHRAYELYMRYQGLWQV